MDWIDLDRGRDQWKALVATAYKTARFHNTNDYILSSHRHGRLVSDIKAVIETSCESDDT
jgi:hypothetical protein